MVLFRLLNGFRCPAGFVLDPVRRVRHDQRRGEEAVQPHLHLPRGRLLPPEPLHLPRLPRIQVWEDRGPLGLTLPPHHRPKDREN